MKGTVLYCDFVSFSAQDGKQVTGYRVCVHWSTYKGENHCAEIWSRTQFYSGDEVRVVRRYKDGKLFVFANDGDSDA